MKPLVLRSAIVASVGGLIFGFDTAVISGTTESLKHVFHLDDAGLGITVTTALIGTILGALITGKPADKYGRKNVLFAIGILYIIGSFGSALAPNYATLIIARFLGGIGVGASSVCAPIYTAEVSPAKVRGRLVGLVQFNIVAGILLAYLSNYVIRILVHDPVENEAIAVSRKLCMTEEESDFQIREIKEALAADASMKKAPFFIKKNMKVIMLAFMIAMFNQLSGINAILYYAPIVMEKAGAATDTAFLMSVGVGAMNLVATMAALTVIDKIGRRTLMIVGSIGYLVSLGFLSWVMYTYEGKFNDASANMVLIGLLVFIAAHAFGQGSVIWVFISEIFPNRIRGMGQSFGSLTHWVFAAITSGIFPVLIGALGGGTAFLIFFICMVGQLIWVFKSMPETKGIPLEEMEAKLGLTAE